MGSISPSEMQVAIVTGATVSGSTCLRETRLLTGADRVVLVPGLQRTFMHGAFVSRYVGGVRRKGRKLPVRSTHLATRPFSCHAT
jgi:hypothetical protein